MAPLMCPLAVRNFLVKMLSPLAQLPPARGAEKNRVARILAFRVPPSLGPAFLVSAIVVSARLLYRNPGRVSVGEMVGQDAPDPPIITLAESPSDLRRPVPPNNMRTTGATAPRDSQLASVASERRPSGDIELADRFPQPEATEPLPKGRRIDEREEVGTRHGSGRQGDVPVRPGLARVNPSSGNR